MAYFMRAAVCLLMVAALAVSAAPETFGAGAEKGSVSSRDGGLTDAESLIKAGKCEEAITLLTEIAASDRESTPQALRMMGNCYKALKNWGKAIKCFEKILTYPDSPLSAKDVRTWMMDCYLANNDTYKGLACLRKLIAEYPNDAARFHYIVGRRYQWMHQYAEAANVLREAIKLPMTDPDAKDAAKRYICCSLSAMDFDSALEYLPVFVSDYPDSIPEVVSKELYRWKFKIPQVIEIIEKAASGTDKDTSELKIGLADCYVATNNWDKGLATLKGIRTSSRSANWHVVMAKCYWGQNKSSEAAEELRQAIIMGSGLDSKKLLMEYYRDMGHFENMFAQAQLLEKEWPENAGQWLMNQGWALLDMGEYEKAVPFFREAISRYPDNRWVIRGSLVSLAECLYRLNKAEEALSVLNEYYAKRPELKSEYLLIYAQTLRYGPHDKNRSITMLKKLIADYPTDPMANEARKFLPGVLQASAKWNEAAEMLQAQLKAVPSWREWDKVALKIRIADNYFKAKNYEKAADAYREVIAATGNTKEAQVTAMYRLAVCQQETGNVEEARRMYRMVLTQYGVPDNIRAKTMYGLALCYWDVRLKNAARRLMQEVSDEYPDTEEARSARETLELWSKG